MKRLSFFLFLFFLWMTVRAQMLRSSGLVLYGGKNTVNYQMASPEKGLPPFDLANSRLGADFTLGAGYRWRLNRPDTGWFFDLPIFARLAYDFRFMEVAVQYKWGMTRKFNMSPFLRNRLSGWECSVYIPLSRRK